MKKWLAALVILLVAALGWLFLFKTRTGPGTGIQPSKADQDAAVEKALATASPEAANAIASNFAAAPTPQTIFYAPPTKSAVAPAGKPQPLQYTNLAPAIVLEAVSHAVHDYASMFGGNPVGVNSEITSQLHGLNPAQADFIKPEEGMRLDPDGQLVDPWGTPYFFHQLSGTQMEIRSAGPDKILWTADDLVGQ